MRSDVQHEDAAPPSPTEFEAEVRQFFEARYPPRERQRAEFVWGHGSDRVPLLDETDLEHLARVREYRRELFDNDLGWITGPTDLGGRGLPSAYQRRFDVIAKQFASPGSGPLTISLGMIAPTIATHGSPSARQRYCAPLHRGDLIACQLFSEPGAGSDLAGLSTSAVRDGDGWRITGQKVWTSGAHVADIGEIICRTAPGPRHRNLTAFVVDMRAQGVEVRPLRQMTGGAAFNEVFFEDVWVSDEDRLGEVDEGWRVAITTLMNERGAIGDDGFGGAGVLDIKRYVAMAEAFDVSADPVIRQALADLYVHLQVAKHTRLRAAARRAQGQVPGPEASLGKLMLTANYRRISDLVSTILGPLLIADTERWGTYAWSEFVLGLPGLRLGGGTDEILKNIVAERVLALPAEPRPS